LKVVPRFVNRGSGQPALIIEQSFVKGGEAFEMVIPPRPWLKKEILVNGSPGEMLSWIDEEGFRWHRASWVRRGRRFDARSVLPEEEFLRIVNSIHR
jgi:hypothetical protein